MRTRGSILLPVLATWVLFAFTGGLAAGQNSHDINQKVRSLLSNKCFACHGPDEDARQADLRLDTREGAIESAIDLDDPDQSELLARIASDDPDTVMPPAKHGKPLTDEEQKLMSKWIKEGATYTSHWSYVKPEKPDVPEIALAKFSQSGNGNEIDRFVQSRLVGTNLQPSKPADRLTIIRRLALDLTGLPPTREEVKNFVNDKSDSAYENLVDHYLSQPGYGERWATVWLDLARYADSAGYADDRKRTIWAYRDYVIRAYNENMPFDQFTIEQIAGDILPSPSESQKVATAFHRNTLTNSEGGTSDQEFHAAAVVDRVNTTMAVWMGTTMACAQCHTHKYDPITQKEYFEFYDFFNQTADFDLSNETPVLEIFSDEKKEKRLAIESEVAAIATKSKSKIDEDDFLDWLKKSQAKYRDSDLKSVQGRFVRVDLSSNHQYLSLAEVKVFATLAGESVNVARKGKATQSSTAHGGSAELAIDGNTDGVFSRKSTTHTEGEENPWWQVDLGKPLPIDSISVWHRTDSGLQKRNHGFRLSVLDENRKVVWSKTIEKALAAGQTEVLQEFPSSIIELIQKSEPLEKDQLQVLRRYFKTFVDAENQKEIAELRRKLKKLKPTTTVPVMQSLESNKHRTTKIQIRGNYLDTGETVTAATPSAFHEFPTDAERNRLALAKWLVDSRNPLAARVVVNRYWEQLFGVGIVSTSEEFGAQGELPSHPDLLDWLAADLVEAGWDTRRLLKQIVMSQTYQQTSSASSQSLKLDPNNRWLSRGPRVRLTAEMIRDQALAVSGLLSPKMFGPPVQPPQPKVGLKPAFSGKTTDWTDSVGENRYRRGIYTEWRRSSPYPSMSTFDVNSREVCELRRSSTNTPLQALVTLNDPVYVEAAQALARRIVTESDVESVPDKASFAFRLCLIRKPTDSELDRISKLFEQTRAHFENDKAAAKELATDPLNPNPEDADLVELAAWTTVANVLLNLDEMLMKP